METKGGGLVVVESGEEQRRAVDFEMVNGEGRWREKWRWVMAGGEVKGNERRWGLCEVE